MVSPAAHRAINVLAFEPYGFEHVGGSSGELLGLLRDLDRSRFSMVFATPFESPFNDRIRELGATAIVVPPDAGLVTYGGARLRDGLLRRIATGASLARYALAIARLLRERRIDVVFIRSLRGMLMAAPAARLCGRPVVWWVDGELQNPWLDRVALLLGRRIVFYTEQNKRDKYRFLTAALRRRLRVVPTGLDFAEIDQAERADPSPLVRELRVSGDTLNLIILGQLYPPKGVHVAIEALAQIRARGVAARLYVVGDHIVDAHRPYRGELDALVARLGLEDAVVFTGWRADAHRILCVMDLLIHASFSEGFGRAVLEAMAVGRPVVATRVGGLREAIVDGENGFLVPPADAAAIADRVVRLAADPALRARMGARARESVRSQYGIDRQVTGLQRIWLDALGHAS